MGREKNSRREIGEVLSTAGAPEHRGQQLAPKKSAKYCRLQEDQNTNRTHVKKSAKYCRLQEAQNTGRQDGTTHAKKSAKYCRLQEDQNTGRLTPRNRQSNNNIIIIAFKGAIRDFLQSPHRAANCLQHARSSGPGAIECKSRATHRALITCNMCYVPLGTKGQLSY